jgi:hypothetical protein
VLICGIFLNWVFFWRGRGKNSTEDWTQGLDCWLRILSWQVFCFVLFLFLLPL